MPVAQGSGLRFQNDLLGFQVDRKEQIQGQIFRSKGRRAKMALFHRNVTVIDVSEDLVLLSPLLLRMKMSQTRLVTFLGREGMGNPS